MLPAAIRQGISVIGLFITGRPDGQRDLHSIDFLVITVRNCNPKGICTRCRCSINNFLTGQVIRCIGRSGISYVRCLDDIRICKGC